MRIDRALRFQMGGMVSVPKVDLTENELGNIRVELTAVQKGYEGLSVDTPVPAFREDDEFIYLPRAWSAKTFGFTIQPQVRPGVEEKFRWNPQRKLRDYQEPAISDMVEGILMQSGGILQAKAGAGKTVMACRIIEALGVRTIVLVHKQFLLSQWRDRIAEYLPGTLVGIIQGKKCEIRPISIAMVQSLVSRAWAYGDDLNRFGLCISDECHRMSAPTWVRAIEAVNSEYRMGLTATPRRSDGLENIFRWHIGDILTTVTTGQLSATVYEVRTGVHVDEQRFTNRNTGTPFTPGIINYLVKREDRNRLLDGIISRAACANRKVLVLSHRIKHLKRLGQRVKGGCGYYIGGLKPEERAQAADCRVVMATYQMAKEALDIKELDTLVLATPVGSIEQATGRILRMCESKKDPIVVDPWDTGLWVDNLRRYRHFSYNRLGYTVTQGK